MSDIKMSSRYAQALIELSLEKQQLEIVFADIELIIKTISGSSDLQLMLSSPIVSKDKKRAVLKGIFGTKLSKMSLDFLEMVLFKSRESALFSIANSFVEIYNKHKNLQPATLISAVSLSSDLVDQIIKVIEKISGAKAILTQQVDPSLIGGYIIKIADTQIDASVRSKLTFLKNQLN